MAINPETQYPGKIAPSTPSYPYGAARNITVPGDGTGTPWEAALVNDLFGWQQALLTKAGIVPTGSPENANSSQYTDAIRAIVGMAVGYAFTTVANMQSGTTIDGESVTLKDGDTVVILERGTSTFDITTAGTINGFDVIDTTTGLKAVLRIDEVINIDDFGAIGDARQADGTLNPTPTNDTAAIQAALRYAAIQGRIKVVASSGKAYRCDRVYIPTTYQAPSSVTEQPNEVGMVVDFQGAEFIGGGATDTNNVFMEAAYFDSNGDMQPVIGTGPEAYLTAGYRVKNMHIRDYYQGFRLRGWVYGCVLQDVFAVDVSQVVFTQRCFYTNFERIVHRGSFMVGVPIYQFEDNNNIMPLKSLVSGNCDIGYRFVGAVEAMKMSDCGIEGFQTYGVELLGQYNMMFDSCYFESGQGIGCKGQGTNSITFDNCWGFGDIQMIGDFTDNTNVRVRDNNRLGGGARWFDSLPNYCISDFDFPNIINPSGQTIDTYDAPDAVNIDQDITVFDGAVGLDYVAGRVEQTNRFHTQRVNGSYTRGFMTNVRAIGYAISQEPESGGTQRVIYDTGIDYSDTQLIYAAFKVAHNTGTWFWYGFIAGDGNVSALYSAGGGDPTVVNNGGKVQLFSPALPSGGNLGPSAGEIRLV